MADMPELIKNVQIENVRVVEANLRTSMKTAEEVLEANIGRNARVLGLPEDGVFAVQVDFKFTVHPDDEKKPKSFSNASIAVGVIFELTYRVPSNMSAPEEDLAEFARVNSVFNAWPYFREFVHASLARMGLPPFILPVYRLSADKKPEIKKRVTRERRKAMAGTT